MANSNNIKTGMLTISIVFVLSSLCFALSYWQYQRFLEKREWSAIKNENTLKKPLNSLPSIITKQYDGRKFAIKAILNLKHIFLRDNKYYNRKAGYLIYAPIKFDGRLYLAELGWTANDSSGLEFPRGVFKGLIVCPKGKEFALKYIKPNPGWPKIIQTLDLNEISRELKSPISGCILSVNSKNPKLQRREMLSPQRHIGYAIQWLLFGIIIVYMYYKLNWGKNHEDS